MDMEVDKAADEVADMEVDMEVVWVTDMKLPIEDLTDATLAIGDTYRDDVRHLVANFSTNASGATLWPNFQLMELAPPGGQIFN